jgi:hypothetical protein
MQRDTHRSILLSVTVLSVQSGEAARTLHTGSENHSLRLCVIQWSRSLTLGKKRIRTLAAQIRLLIHDAGLGQGNAVM